MPAFPEIHGGMGPLLKVAMQHHINVKVESILLL